VLHHWSQWQGSTESYEEITAEDAAAWLSRNDYDDDEAEKAGPDVATAFADLEVK